jgi:drug/metabolite transporter (DMT)-like permease
MAVRDGFQKLLLEDIESYELGFFSGVIGTLLMLPLGFLYFPTNLNFFLTVLLIFSGAASVIAIWMFLVALDIGEMSVVTPLRRISPVIVAVIEPFFLALTYNPKIILGAFLCGAGAYITAVKTENMTTPLKDLAHKAALLAFGVSVFKALGSVATVYLVQEIDYLFLSFFGLLSMALGFGAITYSKQKEFNFSQAKSLQVGLVGVFAVITTVMITYAYSLASATQVMTVKQSTIIFSILIGGKFFSEDNMLRKIIGSLLIIAAIIFVSI